MDTGRERAVQIHDFNIALKMLEYTNFEEASNHLISVLTDFPVAIWSYNLSGEIIFWNKEAESLFGYNKIRVLQKPDPLGLFKRIKSHPEKHREELVKLANGNEIMLQIKHFEKATASNNLQIWVCASEITEMRTQQQELTFHLSKLSNLEKILNHSDSFAYIRTNDADWSLSYISSNINNLGYTPDDFITRKISYSDLIHPSDIVKVKADIHSLSKTNKANARLEYRLITRNSSTIWVSDVMEFIRDENGAVIQTQGILTDINKRKEQEEKIELQNTIIQIRNAELYHTNEELLLSYENLRTSNQRLAESEEKFKIISEQSLLGILILQNNECKYVNQAFLNASGYSKEEVIAWRPDVLKKIIHPDNVYAILDGLYNTMDEKNTREFHTDFRALTKSGVMRWLSLWSKPIQYEGKKALLISLMDIDNVKRWQDSLAESENNLRTKLDFILSPDVQISDFSMIDIYDVAQLQKIQDAFSAIHNVASVISDPQGNPITKPSNFSPVCKLIRSSAKGEALCRDSDKLVGEKARATLKPISAACTTCGLIDAGAPIIVGGKHIATWMIGQKMTNTVNKPLIRDLAKKIDVDADTLLRSFNTMQIQDKAQFDQILDFLWLLAKEISALGYNNVKLAKDIEERKKIDEALRESEELYRQLVQASPDGIALVDTSGNIIYASPQNVNIFGFPKDVQAIGLNILGFIDPVDLPRARLGFLKVIENQETGTENYTMVKANGQKITVEVNSAPVKDYRGFTKGMISILRDITERKKFEEELIKAKNKAEESDQLKSAFLANMSHEIRTPMNGIVGFANLLNEQNLTDQERLEYTSIINKNSKLLLQLIDDILDVAKIEAGQLVIREKPCNITQVLNDQYTLFKHLIETGDKHEIALILTIPQNPIVHSVMMDQARVKQIISNLLSNALKFTRKGKIEFGYTVGEDMITFFVKDTGIGISKDKQQIIFDRFRQADETTSRRYGGTGLGLTISKNLVKLMKGQMWVESELNQGSTFYFTIPYAANAPESKPNIETAVKVPDQSMYNWKGKCILIAEDEYINLVYLQEILKVTGVKIIHASNGEDAIQICKVTPDINLILMDIKMPGVSGYVATREIKKIRPSLPIIAQTAYAMEEEKIRCMEAGCDQYMAKPIDRKKLLSLIHTFIG